MHLLWSPLVFFFFPLNPWASSPFFQKKNTQPLLQVLVLVCRNCGYQEDAPPSEWCVHRSEIRHSARERTVVLRDVRADPTLPCTRDARCPACQHNEAVFFSAPSEEGMTLYFNCTKCGHRWRDYV